MEEAKAGKRIESLKSEVSHGTHPRSRQYFVCGLPGCCTGWRIGACVRQHRGHLPPAARQEVQKGEVVQGKLQELCRELQKQNKQVADQSKEVARLEEARRQAMAAKFDESVKVRIAVAV